jgi:hypothetical protein
LPSPQVELAISDWDGNGVSNEDALGMGRHVIWPFTTVLVGHPIFWDQLCQNHLHVSSDRRVPIFVDSETGWNTNEFLVRIGD